MGKTASDYEVVQLKRHRASQYAGIEVAGSTAEFAPAAYISATKQAAKQAVGE
jgi:hypothetical protein